MVLRYYRNIINNKSLNIYNRLFQVKKVLRQISRLLYNLSPQYRRLLKYFTDMARYDYVIDMINPQLIDQPKETVIKKYRKMIKSVDDKNIKHEFFEK